MDITAAQQITDLRRRIADNVANGRNPNEGIEPEDLKKAIDALRANRSVASSRGGKAAAVTKKAESKVAKAKANPSSNLKALLDGLED